MFSFFFWKKNKIQFVFGQNGALLILLVYYYISALPRHTIDYIFSDDQMQVADWLAGIFYLIFIENTGFGETQGGTPNICTVEKVEFFLCFHFFNVWKKYCYLVFNILVHNLVYVLNAL